METDSEAKIACLVGGSVDVAGTIGTVSAAGVVTGLSAAGVTSGLAAIGSVLGGGMVAGLAIGTSAPLLVGGTTYGQYRWLKS